MDNRSQELCDSWRHMMLESKAKHGTLPSTIVIGVEKSEVNAADRVIKFNHKNRWCLVSIYAPTAELIEMIISTDEALPEYEVQDGNA